MIVLKGTCAVHTLAIFLTPPIMSAVPTPTIFPVPIVAAREVTKAPNWLTSPSASLSLLTESLIAVKM